jgi:protocatechuate 3,4-dioxygenase beta subunit
LADFDATMVGKPADLADFLVQLARIQQTDGPRGRTPFPPGPTALFLRKSWWSRVVLAEKVSVPPAALSMRSERKDLFRRISMLLHPHSQFERRCPRRFQALAALAVFTIIGLAAVLRLEAQEQTGNSRPKESEALADRESAPNPDMATQVRGRVLGPGGKPVSGAKLYLGTFPKGNGGEPELRYHRDQKQMASAVRATSDSDGHFGFAFSNAELIKMGREFFSGGGVRDLVGEVMAVAPGQGCGWAEIDRAAKELTIHMVDDLAVTGRILDGDGRPVAGARIGVVGIGTAPRGDLSAFLIAMQNEPNMNCKFSTVWNGSLPGQPATITCDRDGRFQLTGIGRERLALVSIEGPRIAAAFSWVMTRTGETVKRQKPWDSIFAASFDYVGQPSRLITGTVRNKGTGKPMAGASIYLWGKSGIIKGTTNDNGRYELRGAPKASTYQLVAASGDGLFFDHQVQVQDTPGLDSLRCDIELLSWLTVHGRVTEKETGKPVAGARVDYYPIGGNPYVNKFVSGSWNPKSETTTLPDGSYTLTVMPGPGAIGVTGPNLNDYAPAASTPEERKQFFKTPSVVIDKGDDYLSTATGGRSFGAMFVNYHNALVLIEPGEEEHAIVKDASLERTHELKGRILGPDSQPLTGTTVFGLVRLSVETLKGSEFTVRGLNPKAKRPLVFYHKEKQLGYYLKSMDSRATDLTVKLQPCGSVSGRIVDEDGQPVDGQRVWVTGNTFPSLSGVSVATDANGCFHVVGLVPGEEYSVEFARFYTDITVEAGRDKDLGDIKMKASMN